MCRLCRFGIGHWSRSPNAGLGQKKKCLSVLIILCAWMESNHRPLSSQDSVLPLNYTREIY